MNKYPMSRKEDIVVQEASDEILIYDLKLNKALCLNETAALVWNMCDGKTSVSGIAASLSEKLNKPISDDFVWLAVDQLRGENLLASRDVIPTKFEGFTRRQIVRNVGSASLAALPMVLSLAVPTAAQIGPSCFAAGTRIGASIACPAGPPCSCAVVIGGDPATCCSGSASGTGCLPIPNTTSQQCFCDCD